MAVSGYRRFKIRTGRLTSACISSALWTSRTSSAGCIEKWPLNSPRACETAQRHLLDDSCTCGYYAYKDRDYEPVELWDFVFHGDATAAVTMWGAVCEYESGYRAEHMRVDHIWLDAPSSPDRLELAARLATQYEVGCDIGGSAPRVYESLRQDILAVTIRTMAEQLGRQEEDHEHR